MNQRKISEERTRQRIIDAAKALWARYGFSTTAVRTIAEAAKVSTGALFHSWPSKEAMFADIMERDWPDPAAFARFVLTCSTIEEASEGATIFLTDVAGEDSDGNPWWPGRKS